MKLALITGGSKGLGAALVQQYCDAGWQVREYSRSGSAAGHVDCDFADPAVVTEVCGKDFAALATEQWDEVVLILNAAVLDPIGPLAASTPADWQRHLTVNVTATITALGLFMQHFQALPAAKRVAAISSGAARKAYNGWSLYCASKAALEHMIRSIAIEQLAEAHPITAINIDPGVIDTAMQATIRAAGEDRFPDHERFVRYHAEGVLKPPARVAAAILAILADPCIGGERYSVEDRLGGR